MHKFEIIASDNPKWDTIIRSAYIYDFHHTSFYHNIDNHYNSLLFYAEYNNDFIALPLVIRPIENSTLFDATSVYGYCGPISNKKDFLDLDRELTDSFKKNLLSFFLENKIITAFSRLHPLLNQVDFFSNYGEVILLNKTVTIDLRLTPEDQKKQFRKSTKSEINQLKRNGFSIRESKCRKDIDSFISIYYETMDRVKSTSRYYFSREYFYSFLENTSFKSKLILAIKDEQVAAGAIFTHTDKIMQYHLAGTSEKFISEAPMKLIIDEARTSGNNLNIETLHLGGGVSGHDDDSLFKFKSGFSNVRGQFSIWKKIIDEDKYHYLIDRNKIDKSDDSFFPLYRKQI